MNASRNPIAAPSRKLAAPLPLPPLAVAIAYAIEALDRFDDGLVDAGHVPYAAIQAGREALEAMAIASIGTGREALQAWHKSRAAAENTLDCLDASDPSGEPSDGATVHPWNCSTP